MTLAEMESEVFRILNENSSSPRYWMSADVREALNDGYMEISDVTEWYELQDRLGSSGSLYYNLFDELGDEFLCLKRAYNATTVNWLTTSTVREMDTAYSMWETAEGQPRVMLLRGISWVGLWPKLATITVNDTRLRIDEFARVADGSLTTVDRFRFATFGFAIQDNLTAGIYFFYSAIPPKMQFDADVPGFPEEFHIHLIEYAVYELLSQERDWDRALSYYEDFAIGQERLRQYAKNRMGYDRTPGNSAATH